MRSKWATGSVWMLVVGAVLLLAGLAAAAGTDVQINGDLPGTVQNEIRITQNATNPANLVVAYNDAIGAPGGSPLHTVEATRRQDGVLEVRMPGRPRLLPALPVEVRSKLRERGFACEDPADQTKPWTRESRDAVAGPQCPVRHRYTCSRCRLPAALRGSASRNSTSRGTL